MYTYLGKFIYTLWSGSTLGIQKFKVINSNLKLDFKRFSFTYLIYFHFMCVEYEYLNK